jgi:hypothetical protein
LRLGFPQLTSNFGKLFFFHSLTSPFSSHTPPAASAGSGCRFSRRFCFFGFLQSFSFLLQQENSCNPIFRRHPTPTIRLSLRGRGVFALVPSLPPVTKQRPPCRARFDTGQSGRCALARSHVPTPFDPTGDRSPGRRARGGQALHTNGGQALFVQGRYLLHRPGGLRERRAFEHLPKIFLRSVNFVDKHTTA